MADTRGGASWAQRLKPAARARTHLLAAALLWTAVGAVLAGFGGAWLWGSGAGPVWFAVAVVAGAAKGRLVIVRAARGIADRIAARGDGRCLGGFLSWRTWLLVAVMAGSGRLLRASPAPRSLVGGIYLAVGVALLAGAATLWRELG